MKLYGEITILIVNSFFIEVLMLVFYLRLVVWIEILYLNLHTSYINVQL